jgi:ABC-2 type transport system permease protein
MEDYRTLRLLDRFERIFGSFGVDYRVMRKILQLKLTMDGRRVPTIFSQNARKPEDKEKNNQYIKSLWIYVLFGLFMIPFLLMGENYLFQMSLFYGIFTFFVMTSMISDFSTVLLDIRDRNILFPKPVDRRTINTAKMVHVVIYLSFLTVALVAIPLFVGLFRIGPLFFLTAIINIILIDQFIVGLTALIYLAILRFFDGEKLKDLINYVQIGLSLMIMVGYQLLIRSFSIIDFSVSLEPKWWQILLFPMWFGANTEMVLNGSFQPFYILFTALSIVVPLFSVWLYMKFNSTFEENLQKLAYHGKAKEKKRSKAGQFLLRVICRSKEERAFFKFASSMMKNERDFKLKVYPSLGFSIVIPFLLIFSSLDVDLSRLAGSKSYLSIYFSMIIIPTIMILLKYSGKYKGSWIFRAAPIDQLGPMFSGTIKAFIVKLYLPIFLILSVLFVLLFGAGVVPDLAVVFINACTYAVICFLILKTSIPFSESFDEYNQNGNGVIIFGLMLFAGLFAGLHYLSTLLPYGIYLYLAVALIYLALFWRLAFKVTWKDVIE